MLVATWQWGAERVSSHALLAVRLFWTVKQGWMWPCVPPSLLAVWRCQIAFSLAAQHIALSVVLPTYPGRQEVSRSWWMSRHSQIPWSPCTYQSSHTHALCPSQKATSILLGGSKRPAEGQWHIGKNRSDTLWCRTETTGSLTTASMVTKAGQWYHAHLLGLGRGNGWRNTILFRIDEVACKQWGLVLRLLEAMDRGNTPYFNVIHRCIKGIEKKRSIYKPILWF